MKISFVLPEHNLSGGNRVVSCYAQALQSRGHEITLIAPPNPPTPIRDKIRMMLGVKGWNRQSFPETNFYNNANFKIKTLNTYRPVVENDVPDGDIIIATWWKTLEWVNKFPDQKGIKVHFIQGYDATDVSPADKVNATWKLPFYKITVSNWLSELGRKQINVKVDKIIHNSVDTTQFYSSDRIRPKTPTIGFLFSDYPGKGTNTAITVLQELKKNHPDLRGVCFGNPSPGSEINLPDWIEFYQQPAQEKIRDIYSSCNLWLYASQQDGFGLTPLEALACRCPVVTTRVGAMPELIDNGRNGYLVGIGDKKAMTEKISEILSYSDQEWLNMSNNALTTALEYSWKDATDLMEYTLNNLVKKKAIKSQSDNQQILAA